MPSASLRLWQTTRATTLDEIEAAHASVGGLGRGRRFATQQVNHAYVVLLSGQFQGFCRDLHSESVRAVVRTVPVPLQSLVGESLSRNRLLDKGNPNAGNVGSDFGRFDFAFWQGVYLLDRRNQRRRELLEKMNEWRNAIAHQDFNRVTGEVQLRQVRQWRSTCDALTKAFDQTMSRRLAVLIGTAPW